LSYGRIIGGPPNFFSPLRIHSPDFSFPFLQRFDGDDGSFLLKILGKNGHQIITLLLG